MSNPRYNNLHIAGINYESMVDGDGVRAAIYFSGCSHHCPNCHNPQTWDPDYGKPVTEELITEISSEIIKRSSFLSGITLTGGDPFYNPIGLRDFYQDLIWELALYESVDIFSKPTWFYTGYDMKTLGETINLRPFASKGDVIVDGRFDPAHADKTLRFRGSSNQRIFTCTAYSGDI